MTDYVWFPVTGDGQTQATQYIWNTGVANWNTTSDWVQGSTLVFNNPTINPGAIPGSGGGTGIGHSQGPGLDNVGLVAGAVTSLALQSYVADPSKGNPFIGSNVYSVNLLINSGTVDINSLLLSGFNQYRLFDAQQLPTLDVEGATFKVEGSIANSATVIFPTITNVPVIGTAGGVLPATGGGTVAIGTGGTVQIAGPVQTNIRVSFKDGANDLLNLGGVGTLTPNAFAGTIAGFAAGDTIFLPALPSPASYTKTFLNNVLTISNGTTTLATLPIAGTYKASGFSLLSRAGGTAVVTCFAAGTAIRTSRGEVKVEDLTTEDHVISALSGNAVKIAWIGRRRVDCRRHPDPASVNPVCVSAGAFADGVPNRDLYLSPDHAVHIDGALIPVKHLLNGETISQIVPDTIEYFHIELPEHDLLLAEALAVESYLDTDNHASFDGVDPIQLHPVFGVRQWDIAACAPIVVTGPRLDAARQHLAERAARWLIRAA